MRCRSYLKTTKPSMTTPSTPSFTGKMVTGNPSLGPQGPLQPASGFPSQETGRSAENLSLLFGILSLVCIPGIRWTLYAIPFSLILSVLGIWQARVARRHGARATAGMILSVVGIVVVLLLVALIILILNALSGIH